MSVTMSEKIKVSYYVPTAVARAVRLLAAQERRSQSDVAGEALEEYLVDRQDDLDWLRAAEPAFEFWDNELDAEYDAI